MNKYICVKDLQGGDFAVGSVETAYGWLERATGWRDSDNSWGDWGDIKDGDRWYKETRTRWVKAWRKAIRNGKEQELIDYIADVWGLEFAKKN